MELLSKLGIDWKLLAAQVVNFTILAGVLTYFVYRPLLDLLDARRERIRKALEDAQRIDEQKREMERERERRLRALDEEAGTFLERAQREAAELKRQILASARTEADQVLGKGRAQLERERAQVMAEAQGAVAQMVLRLTRKILEREFSPADQRRLLLVLQKELPSTLR